MRNDIFLPDVQKIPPSGNGFTNPTPKKEEPKIPMLAMLLKEEMEQKQREKNKLKSPESKRCITCLKRKPSMETNGVSEFETLGTVLSQISYLSHQLKGSEFTELWEELTCIEYGIKSSEQQASDVNFFEKWMVFLKRKCSGPIAQIQKKTGSKQMLFDIELKFIKEYVLCQPKKQNHEVRMLANILKEFRKEFGIETLEIKMLTYRVQDRVDYHRNIGKKVKLSLGDQEQLDEYSKIWTPILKNSFVKKLGVIQRNELPYFAFYDYEMDFFESYAIRQPDKAVDKLKMLVHVMTAFRTEQGLKSKQRMITPTMIQRRVREKRKDIKKHPESITVDTKIAQSLAGQATESPMPATSVSEITSSECLENFLAASDVFAHNMENEPCRKKIKLTDLSSADIVKRTLEATKNWELACQSLSGSSNKGASVTEPITGIEQVVDEATTEDKCGFKEKHSRSDIVKNVKTKLEEWVKSELVSYGNRNVLLGASFFKDPHHPLPELLKSIYELSALTLNKLEDDERFERLQNDWKDMGFCCGIPKQYLKRPTKCDNKHEQCLMAPETSYHEINMNGVYHKFCTRHFKKGTSHLTEEEAKKFKKRVCGLEELEECSECGKFYHTSCREAGELKERACVCGIPEHPMVSPSTIPETPESNMIQESFVQAPFVNMSIIVRILTSGVLYEECEDIEDENKTIESHRKTIRDFYRQHAKKDLKLAYRSKLILAFAKPPNGYHVLFFGMMTREYAEIGSLAKRGQVSVEYVDSVQFLDKSIRTNVYLSIMNSYLKGCRNRCFTVSSFWACPPKENEEYLLLGHPEEQKTGDLTRLRAFYKSLTDKGGDALYSSVEFGIPSTKLSTLPEIIEHAFASNSEMFKILHRTIMKYKKYHNTDEPPSRDQVEKFKEILGVTANRCDGENFYNLNFNQVLREDAKIVPSNSLNISSLAECSDNFTKIQSDNGLEFSVPTFNMMSTSLISKLILESIGHDKSPQHNSSS